MSLIHQALKKLEGSRQRIPDRPVPASGAPGGAAGGSVRPAANVPARFLLALAFLAAVSTLSVYILLGGSLTSPRAGGGEARRTDTTGIQAGVTSPAANTPRAGDDAATGHNDRGLALFASGRYADAAREFESASGAAPESVVYRTNLGLALLRAGRFDGAEEVLAEALDLDGTYPAALNNMGLVLASRGEYSRALEFFEEAAKVEPGYADAHLNAAVSLDHLGRLADSLAAYERFLAVADVSGDGGDYAREVRKKTARIRATLALGDGPLKGTSR